jgi:gamma-glutamylputrescine oxidase
MTAQRPPIEGDLQAEVVILGGGVAACAAALELARRGKVPHVVATAIAPEAGELGHVCTGPGLAYAPVCDRLGASGARDLWEQSREGHIRLRELLNELADDCGYERAGGFRVATDRPAARALASGEDMLRDDGFPGDFLDHYLLEARFDVRGFTAAYWAADDGVVDARRLVDRTAAAAESHGAVLHEGGPILELDLRSDGVELVTARGRLRAEQALVADALPPQLAGALEARTIRAETRSFLCEVEPAALLPSPTLAVDGSIAWRTRDGALAVSGSHADADGLVAGSFPALLRVSRRGEPCAMLRTPDGLPLVGMLPGLPVAVSCGYGGLACGWAVPAARWAAQALLDGREAAPLALRAARKV